MIQNINFDDTTFICYCGKYDWLMPLFSSMFNRMWNKNIPIYVVSHIDCDVTDWPDNFKLIKVNSSNFSHAILEFYDKGFCKDKIFWMTEDLIMYDKVDYEYLKKGITYFDEDERLLKFSLHFYPGNQNELTPSPNPVGANNIITQYSHDNDFVQWNFGYPCFAIAFYKTLQFYESLVRIKDYYNEINNTTLFSPHQWEKYPWHTPRHKDFIRESTLVCKKKVIYPNDAKKGFG